jgi:cation diffusion facilitator CzcD-associated flavoprotein CzcO
MPEGMFLKSPGRASNLSDPAGTHTLKRFCALNGREYRDWDWPVPIEVLVSYGQWFQQELVPSVESVDVLTCSRGPRGFRLQLEGGETVAAKSVVVANGYRHSARTPEEVSSLAPHLVSHSSAHFSFAPFKGKSVVVVGAGQSALESAALLKESGASPLLLARRDCLGWNNPPVLRRTPYQEVRYPRTGLGIGLRYAFYEHPFMPFYYLPRKIRREHLDTVLGPSGAWWLRERVLNRFPSMLGWRLRGARSISDRVALEVERDGQTTEVRADHVVAATGYHIAPRSFPFLDADLQAAVRWDNGSPTLSRRFESTATGLHFIGVASARCFGPVMRFLDGAQVTAPRLADHLARRRA